MRNFLIGIIVVTAVVVGIAQFFLPSYISGQLESRVTEVLKPEKSDLHVDSTPAVRMLAGHFDSIAGELNTVQLGDLEFSAIRLDLKNIEIDPFDLAMNKTVTVSNAGGGYVEGIVTEGALKAFMEKKVNGLSVDSVTLNAEGVSVTGEISIGGFLSGTATVGGQMELKNNALVFSPQRLAINGTTIGGLTSAVLKEIAIYDFVNFPIPVTAERIDLSGGEMHVMITPQARR